jgi:hypothetical protein
MTKLIWMLYEWLFFSRHEEYVRVKPEWITR